MDWSTPCWRLGPNRQGVDIGLHHLAQRGIDRAVPRDWRHAFERGADDMHRKMPVALRAARMPRVLVAVVFDFEQLRRERGFQQHAHAFDPFGIQTRDIGGGVSAHGNTGRNGRTSTRTYTPASM